LLFVFLVFCVVCFGEVIVARLFSFLVGSLLFVFLVFW
jgi:hypothetical protein